MKAKLEIPIVMAVLLLASCAAPPSVIQGTVLQCGGGMVSVRDETAPDRTIEFSLQGADIGAMPNPGDVVRIAYQIKDGKRIATRVMNISRQKDLLTGK